MDTGALLYKADILNKLPNPRLTQKSWWVEETRKTNRKVTRNPPGAEEEITQSTLWHWNFLSNFSTPCI
jgi:hypothetical protein